VANIKSLDQSSDKWKRRAAVAGPDYEFGVRNPRRSWAQASSDAEGNYKTAVVQAANQGRYGQGIKKTGEAGWQENAIAKGPSRFSEGVALAQQSWANGFAPFHAAIKTLKLPPRGPKGSPQNLQRVAAMSAALRAVSQKKGA